MGTNHRAKDQYDMCCNKGPNGGTRPSNEADTRAKGYKAFFPKSRNFSVDQGTHPLHAIAAIARNFPRKKLRILGEPHTPRNCALHPSYTVPSKIACVYRGVS